MWYNSGMKRKWLHRNWYWITIIGVAVISFLVYLGWKHGIAISFAVLSIIVATFFASRSLKLTQDSLLLTRDTTRPFLNVSRIAVIWFRNDGQPTTVNYIFIGISNAGVFPADQVSILFNVCKTNGDNQKHLFIMKGGKPPIYFPNEDTPNLMFIEADDKQKITVKPQGKLKVRIEISYENKLTKKEHKTVRSYEVQYLSTAQEPIPIPGEDYWY